MNELLIDGEVEGTIDSTGTLTIGEHARIRAEIRAKSVKVRGTVEGNIFVTERCEPKRVARCMGTSKRRGCWLMRMRHFLAAQRSGRESHSQSDVSPAEPNAISNAKFHSRSRDAVIRVYDESATVMPSLLPEPTETTEQRFTRRTRQKFTLLWRWLPDDRGVPFYAVLSDY